MFDQKWILIWKKNHVIPYMIIEYLWNHIKDSFDFSDFIEIKVCVKSSDKSYYMGLSAAFLFISTQMNYFLSLKALVWTPMH